MRTTRVRRGCPQRGPSTVGRSVCALLCYRSPAPSAERELVVPLRVSCARGTVPSSLATLSGRRFLSQALRAPGRASSNSAWRCGSDRPRAVRLTACDSACECRHEAPRASCAAVGLRATCRPWFPSSCSRDLSPPCCRCGACTRHDASRQLRPRSCTRPPVAKSLHASYEAVPATRSPLRYAPL